MGKTKPSPLPSLAIVYDRTEVVCRGEPLSEIWWQGRQWAVTSYGLEQRNGAYVIEAKRLLEDGRVYSWVEHVGEKNWVDVDDFATAYLVAVAMHGHRLTRAMRALVMKGHARSIVSHEKQNVWEELFPRTGGSSPLMTLSELDRRCKLVDEEYERRRAAKSEVA